MKKAIILFIMFLLVLTGCNSSKTTGSVSSSAKLADLEAQIEKKDETIAELRETLEEKNAEILDLESSSNTELENQLAAAEVEIENLIAQIEMLLPYKYQVEELQAMQEEAGGQGEYYESPVEITITDFYSDDYGDVNVEGELLNISDMNLQYIELYVTFSDNAGNIIDSTTTYADADILEPGARTKFYTYVTDDTRIQNVTVELLDYSTGSW